MSLHTYTQTRKPPIDQTVPSQLETATFGLGWFWTPDARFGSLNGIYRTRVGYAGGTTPNPTYRRMGDHTETFQIDFDPTIISYMDILQLFWKSHNPKRKSWSRQYRDIILYENESQHQQAKQSMMTLASSLNAPVETDILPLTTFYLAEDYHQKYRLQNTPLMGELRMIYPDTGWIDSTAAAKLNGYLSGYGIAETFAADVTQFGLSESGKSVLMKSVAMRREPLTCPLPR